MAGDESRDNTEYGDKCPCATAQALASSSRLGRGAIAAAGDDPRAVLGSRASSWVVCLLRDSSDTPARLVVLLLLCECKRAAAMLLPDG